MRDSTYSLAVWHGSGLTDTVAAVRILKSVRRYLQLEKPIPVFGGKMLLSAVVRGSSGHELVSKLSDSFCLMLSQKNSDPMMIVCLDGGTGAARVVSNISYHRWCGAKKHVVVGGSDNSLYILAAWLLEYTHVGFYGINTLDMELIPALERVYEYLEGINRIFTFNDVRAEYTCDDGMLELPRDLLVLPMTIRPMIQTYSAIRERFLGILASRPCLLMLEDAYPPDDLNWIGFYEDLTHLIPFLKCVSAGKGAVAFAPIPGSACSRSGAYYGERVPDYVLIREATEAAEAPMPIFTNVHFGHQTIPGATPVIPFGVHMRVTYTGNCLTLVGDGGAFAEGCDSPCEGSTPA